jgi:KaiC/GvpD/RAD55 family RecA-like ATPase
MIEDEDDLAFLQPATTSTGAEILPFPRMRPNAKVSERWKLESQKRGGKRSLTTAVSAARIVVERRAYPRKPFPSQWQNLARRCVTYAGDMNGVVGPQGGGKTSFCLQHALAEMAEGTPSLWAPLELDPAQVVSRLAGNMHNVHANYVRDEWPQDRLQHVMSSIEDMWMFIDRHRDPDKQLREIETMIDIAWDIYQVPPSVYVDHIGKLVMGGDRRTGTADALESLREMCVSKKCFITVLSQGSRENQEKMTGRKQVDTASELAGMAAEARQFEEDCTNLIVLNMFKVDASLDGKVGRIVDAHVSAAKCRNTGLEGPEGYQFDKHGGRFTELDHLPITPAEIKSKSEDGKRDKMRISQQTPQEIRTESNAARADSAEIVRRSYILQAIGKRGMLGMELHEIRRIPGAGRGPMIMDSLAELERQGCVERTSNNHWRTIGRI